VLGLHYAPHHADTDRDGIADDDGCPDPDNDNDLSPDVDDLCPLLRADGFSLAFWGHNLMSRNNYRIIPI
jgi:hypothetical protein